MTRGADWSAWGKCSVCGKGYRHCAVDRDGGAVGREVVAIEAGVVKASAYQTQWNSYVIIEHTLSDGSKLTSLYYHLANVTVKAGASVSRGQKLGTISATYSDNSHSAPHLHFGTRQAPYSSTMSLMGALPTCSHAGYSFPEKFVDPTAFIRSHP